MLDLTAAYENYLKNVKHASENTVASYMRDIRQYKHWLIYTQDTEIADATREDVQNYMTHLTAEGRSSSTLNRNLASLKNLYIYLNSAGFIDQSPVVDIVVEPIEKKIPQILSGREIELLLSQPSLTDAKGIRDKAMLEILYATGMRVTELIDLDYDDVNLDVGVLDRIFKVGNIKIKHGNSYTVLYHLTDCYKIYKIIQTTILDIQTDIEYPNALRPDENPGYDTKSKNEKGE